MEKKFNIDTASLNVEKPKRTTFDEKNYLNVKLAKNENEKELVIRVLPIDSTSRDWYKIIHMHTIKVPQEISEYGSKSYVCLRKTKDINHDVYGYECPFCEANRIAWENYNKAVADEDEVEMDRWKNGPHGTKATKAGVVGILRVIERGRESDGPKFWKFTIRDDKKDPKNLIEELHKTRKNESIEEAKIDNGGVLPEDFEPLSLLDLYEGKDFKVTISRQFDKDGKPTKKTTVSIIDYGRQKPLSNDYNKIEEWCGDKKVWSDVFVVKPYEYLSIIADGEIPFFDKEKSKWVTKGRARDPQVKESVRNEREAQNKIEAAKRAALDDAGYEDDGEVLEPEIEREYEEESPF